MDTLAIVMGFGALGGLGQALLAQKGVLSLPTRGADGGKLDLGFFADTIIGAMGALGGLLVGALVLRGLNPQLLAGNAGVGDILGEISAWVYLASFGVLTGFSSRRLLPAVSDRFMNAITERVQEETEKATLEITEATSLQVSTVLDQVSAFGELHLQPAPDGSPTGLAALEKLVDEYDTLEGQTWEERVLKKDGCYSAMSRAVLASNVAAQDLVTRFVADHKQGWVLALAALASARPRRGLGDLLLAQVPKVTWKHVVFRVVSAIGILATQGELTQGEAVQAETTFGAVAVLDDSLRRKIVSTSALLVKMRSSLPR